MNKRFLIFAIIVICLAFIAGICYACQWPPTAIISEPIDPCYVCIGETVDFDGSDSHDNDENEEGEIVEYYWDFGDGNDSNEASPSHDYEQAGVYTVILYVTDDEDDWDAANCTVYVIEVDKVVKEGTTDEEGPIYVCLNETVDLEAIPYPARAEFPSGEPHWEFVEQPEDGDASLDPEFDSDTTTLSDLTVAGEYKVKAKCGDEDVGDEITIVVVTVEKVVEAGTSDEGPLYKCKGETVSLEALPTPADGNFPDGEPHWEIVEQPADANAVVDPCSGSATTTLSGLTKAGDYVVAAKCGDGDVGDEITVKVVGVGEIHIRYATSPESWDDVTEEPNLVVLKGTKYTFKAFPDPVGASWPSGPSWSGVASGTGETIDVNFPSEGTYTLTAKCCSADEGKTVTITVVEPTVYQLGFGGDHTLYETPDAGDPNDPNDPNSEWNDGTTAFTDPVYDSETGDNNSVCITKNSASVSLTNVKLKVTEAISYSTTITVDANGTEEWNEAGVSFSGTTSGEATLGITGNIINQVKKYGGNFQIQWKYKVPSGTNTYYTINTTNHTMYVTYDTPSPGGADLTEQRINWACVEADGATTPEAVADGIHDGLGGVDPPKEPEECNPCTLSDDWSLLSGCPYYGECDEQANLMELGTEILGGSAYTDKVYASSNSGAGNCLDLENKTEGGVKKWLILDFDTGGGYNWNAFEGCCVAGGSWYAVWPKEKATDDYDMLKNEIAPQQYWVKTYSDIPPGNPGWGVQTIYAEEPLP